MGHTQKGSADRPACYTPAMLTQPRFRVITCTGWNSTSTGVRRPGFSAHVIDNWYNGHVVKSFRSEGREELVKGTMGPQKALEKAETYAQELNEEDGEQD